MIPYADIMKISDEETALLTDFADPHEAAKRCWHREWAVWSLPLEKTERF